MIEGGVGESNQFIMEIMESVIQGKCVNNPCQNVLKDQVIEGAPFHSLMP